MDERAAQYMKKVHESNFAMLCEVDRICKKHGIRYYLHGGTLLGAIRHGDFIPWDDDVDISFVRSEYRRFLEAFEAEADPRFGLIRVEEYPQFFDFMTKIVDKSVTYRETSFGAEDFYGGRYSHPTADLFVFDIKKSDWQLTRLKMLYALALGHRPYINYRHFSGVLKVVAFCMAAVGKLVPMKRIAAAYEKVQTAGGELGYGDAELPCIFISNEQMNPRYWGMDFQAPHILPGYDIATIRGKEFPIPLLHEEWLTRYYGDYMALPPADKQTPQHVREIVE